MGERDATRRTVKNIEYDTLGRWRGVRFWQNETKSQKQTPRETTPFAELAHVLLVPFLQMNTPKIKTRTIGNTTYVNHSVDSMDDARRLADQICLTSMLPVYFGTGYAVDRAHIVRLDYGSELVLRFFPNGEDRSGAADDYTTVHSFPVTAREWPSEKQLAAEAKSLESARHWSGNAASKTEDHGDGSYTVTL